MPSSRERLYLPGEKEKEITRRDFLKFSGLVSLGTGMSWFCRDSISSLSEGLPKVETAKGTFRFLYELHEIGIKSQKIPRNIDIYFKEGIWGKDLLNYPALTISSGYMSPELLKQVGKRKAEVCFGDVEVAQSVNDLRLIGSVEILAGFAGLLHLRHFDFENKRRSLPKMKRRTALKIPAVLALSASLEPAFLVANMFSMKFESDNPFYQSLRRVINRLHGLQTHFHPEVAVTLFRNALWAEKLLFLGNHLSHQLGRKPEIVCHVGAAHSGVEDFLKLGQEFCRLVLLNYPPSFISKTLELNGGARTFSSVRLIRPPSDLSGVGIEEEKWSRATDRILLDEEFFKLLQNF